MSFIKRLFKRKPIKEKIVLRVRGNKLIYVYCPESFAKQLPMIRQQIACYEIKLNGHPFNRGLGGY
jgi:hypothetical protein